MHAVWENVRLKDASHSCSCASVEKRAAGEIGGRPRAHGRRGRHVEVLGLGNPLSERRQFVQGRELLRHSTCSRARFWVWCANGIAAGSSSKFLKLADAHYPAGARIRVVLDNHAAHIAQETRAFLGTLPNRFEFTFTPKHGSWLNLIESFFGKMAKTLLRGIRVASAVELQARTELYLEEVNETPVVFRWKYKLETLSVV